VAGAVDLSVEGSEGKGKPSPAIDGKAAEVWANGSARYGAPELERCSGADLEQQVEREKRC
jgi:hypothetical protein